MHDSWNRWTLVAVVAAGQRLPPLRALATALLRLAACVIACGHAPAFAASADREWFTLGMEGQRVGYAWRETRTVAGEQVQSQVTRVYVAQLQRASLVESTIEVARDTQGEPRWIRVQSINGIDRSGWRGTVSEQGRTLRVRSPGSRTERAVSLPSGVVWPDQLVTALERVARPGAARPVALALLDVGTATVINAEARRTANLDAGLTRVDLVASLAGNRARTESLWFDASGKLARRERMFYGTPLLWNACDRQCDAHVAQPFDLIARLVVPSPFRIPPSALDGPIRYVISRKDGAAPRLPTTGEQEVVVDGGSAVVTICGRCGKPAAMTEAERRSYLASNAWMQADAREIRDFARLHSGRGKPAQVMVELVDAVRGHMTGVVDYVGYATALQALQSRSGDCTEFSVLLAAAARARGIPARVVVGLVYAGRFSGKKDVFSPHTWVQAWIGDRWVSYDAGLERFDATHIALLVSDGDPRNIDRESGGQGQWRIEKLGLVK